MILEGKSLLPIVHFDATDGLDSVRKWCADYLNAPAHPIRNQLARLTADSPDLFAIIRQDGKV
jgi:hypothetical protein